MRAALVLVLVLAACGGSQPAEIPLARVVDHLREHGFVASEVAPRGDPRPEAAVLVHLDGATAAIYAYGSEQDAQAATERFSAEEQAAPARIRVQREGLNVFVGRAPVGEKLPAGAVRGRRLHRGRGALRPESPWRAGRAALGSHR